MLQGNDFQTWDHFLKIEATLTQLFFENPEFGVLSRTVFEKVSKQVDHIHVRIKQLDDSINDIYSDVNYSSSDKKQLDEAIIKLRAILPRLKEDMRKIDEHKSMADKLKKLGREFYIQFQIALVKKNYRTPLKALNRFRLNEGQERLVLNQVKAEKS